MELSSLNGHDRLWPNRLWPILVFLCVLAKFSEPKEPKPPRPKDQHSDLNPQAPPFGAPSLPALRAHLFWLPPSISGGVGVGVVVGLDSAGPPSARPPSAGPPSENSKRAQLRVPALQTPPKFHEKTPRDTKRAKRWRERERKTRNFGPRTRGPTLRGPTLRGPFGAPSGPHPSGVCSSMLCFFFFFILLSFFLKKKARRLKHQFWPKSDWPKSASAVSTR